MHNRILPFALLSVTSLPLYAAWSLEPSYYLRAEQNDNIHLAAQNEIEVTGGTFSPRLAVIMEEETERLTGDIDLSFTRYQDHEELDRDEGKLGLDWLKRTELNVFGFNGGYSKRSSLDPNLDVSGISDQQVNVFTANLSPSWQYRFAERWALRLNLSYKEIEYDEPGYVDIIEYKIVNFLNYTDKSAGITLVHNITEQDDLNFSFYQSKYEGLSNGLQPYNPFVPGVLLNFFQANERRVDYDYTMMQLGYMHRFNEVQSVNLLIGSSNSDGHNQIRLYTFDVTGVLSNVGNWLSIETNKKTNVYNIAYNQAAEISRFELSAGRNRVASSTGGLDEVDTASVVYSRNTTELFSWSIAVTATYQKPDINTNIQSVADYKRINFSPSAYYKFNKDWSMSLGYRYSRFDSDLDQQPRESNAVLITMSWRDPNFISTN